MPPKRDCAPPLQVTLETYSTPRILPYHPSPRNSLMLLKATSLSHAELLELMQKLVYTLLPLATHPSLPPPSPPSSSTHSSPPSTPHFQATCIRPKPLYPTASTTSRCSTTVHITFFTYRTHPTPPTCPPDNLPPPPPATPLTTPHAPPLLQMILEHMAADPH